MIGGGGVVSACKSYGCLPPTEKAKMESEGKGKSQIRKKAIQSAKLPERIKVELEKKKRGRPIKMTIQRYADNPPLVLPKTDHQRIKELKELMIRSGGKDVAQKVIQIALDDNHPGQMVALKMCIDRTLPVSMFEKDKHQRSAVTINITGLGQTTVEPTVLEGEDITDV